MAQAPLAGSIRSDGGGGIASWWTFAVKARRRYTRANTCADSNGAYSVSDAYAGSDGSADSHRKTDLNGDTCTDGNICTDGYAFAHCDTRTDAHGNAAVDCCAFNGTAVNDGHGHRSHRGICFGFRYHASEVQLFRHEKLPGDDLRKCIDRRLRAKM
ncbi:MAG: hypothetical protein J6S59_04080 [Clostridia bacterium]|nr:hypothetical protein [Clostridia bacterium]